MNEYKLTLNGGGEPYVEEIHADFDADAIEMAESAVVALHGDDWTEAVLLDNEGAEIWCRHRASR